jgi:mannose-6-phosphate isomerase
VSNLPDVFPIGGALRRYAWGSTHLIQDLLGDTPDGRPAAELWFGAHHGDPSPALGTTLDRLLADEPLPFLAKILAAEQALSIQVHPTRAQAEAGFDREEAEGIPRDARERNYVDRNHKPELLCALTPFEALCGFRPVERTLALLDEVAVPELAFVADLLRGPDGLRAAFTAVLNHPDPAGLAHSLAAAEHPDLWPVRRAAEHFPGDVGVVLAVLLNPVRLEPGQAIYLGAGNVHAYLRGMGVEVMASSDNVLRCGLTSKHIDVSELLAITDFRELEDPVREPVQVGQGWWDYPVPVPDFLLSTVDLDANGGSIDATAVVPQILLCVTGRVIVGVNDRRVELEPGHAAFVPTPQGNIVLSGTGRVCVVGSRAD